MKESIYKNYDDLPLFLNAATIAKVLGVAPSSAYVVVAKSAQLRFRLSAKTALASLLLLSPQSRCRLCGDPIGFPVLKIGSRMVVPKKQFIRWVEQNTEGGDIP